MTIKDGGGTIQEQMPKDGSQFYVTYRNPCRWKPYKPISQQYKHGKRGRWQLMNEYCGWENAPRNFDPVDFQARATPQPDPVRDELVELEEYLKDQEEIAIEERSAAFDKGDSLSERLANRRAAIYADVALRVHNILSKAKEGQS